MRLRLALLCSSLATVHPLTLPGAPPASKPAYALHDAAQAGDASAVSLLLLSGLPPEERNAKESTALHLAALHGHDGVAEVLLDGGAAVNARNSDGMTPLHAAARAGHLEIAELLLARGAEAEAASNSGLRPIRLAAQQADATMIAALRGAGADMDADTAEAAFWAAVKVVDSMPEDEALPTEVRREGSREGGEARRARPSARAAAASPSGASAATRDLRRRHAATARARQAGAQPDLPAARRGGGRRRRRRRHEVRLRPGGARQPAAQGGPPLRGGRLLRGLLARHLPRLRHRRRDGPPGLPRPRGLQLQRLRQVLDRDDPQLRPARRADSALHLARVRPPPLARAARAGAPRAHERARAGLDPFPGPCCRRTRESTRRASSRREGEARRATL